MKKIDLSKYDYELPKERIAQYPLADRSQSKLLVASAKERSIKHLKFNDLVELLPLSSHLFINVTKVIPARLNLMKKTGGRAELLLLEPFSECKDYEVAMRACSPLVWRCIVGGRRIKPCDVLTDPNAIDSGVESFKAEIIEVNNKEVIVEISWKPWQVAFAEILSKLGRTPLPPYICREAIESDRTSYQTVYSKYDGSVAAPTAGLHFTRKILSQIEAKGINISELTLHVGAGTFLPIANDNFQKHVMHSELFSVTLDMVQSLYNSLVERKKIVATGTTTMRTLESLYWLGVKVWNGYKLTGDVLINQSEPYSLKSRSSLLSPISAVNILLAEMRKSNLGKIIGKTQLFIVPGYEIKFVDALITNYHVPKSTLILLVAAFLGGDFWKEVYREALDNGYRFLSYGDASLLLRF